MTATAPALPDLTTPRAQVLLAIGDDALISGHRASHWTGVAPSLEEDLAFSTIAQDGVNHADLYYQLVLVDAEVTDQRAAVDALGLGRSPEGYRHAVVCERPPCDFAYTLARHWAFEHFDAVRLETLADSSDAEVAALAVKLRHELRYHLEHAELWFDRLVRAGDEAKARFRDALDAVLPEALGLFEPVPDEAEAVASGLLPLGHPQLRERWAARLTPTLAGAELDHLMPAPDDEPPADAAGGRAGRHTGDFTEDMWPEMTRLHREHPGARW